MSNKIQYRIREFNKRFYPQYAFQDNSWSDFSSKDVFQRTMPAYPVWFSDFNGAKTFLDERIAAINNLDREIIHNYP